MPRPSRSANEQLAVALQQLQQANAAGPDRVVARESQRRGRDPGVIREEGLRAWSDYDRQPGDPNYFGMTAAGWLDQEAEMMQDIARNHWAYELRKTAHVKYKN